jgi:hypothetical protein
MGETKRDATPGPWLAAKCADGNYEITTPDGDVMATVYGDDDDPECWPASSNAQRLAAAPDLLALVKFAVAELEDDHDLAVGAALDQWLVDARTAIAKADSDV